MKKHNVFAGAFIDRLGHKRQDRSWLNNLIKSPDARFTPVWNHKCLVDGDPPHITLLKRSAVNSLMYDNESIFLGMFGKYPVFTFSLIADKAKLSGQGKFHELRYLGGVLPADEANLVAHAIALIKWHQLL